MALTSVFLPTLIAIDVQRAFDDPRWGERNNPDAEKQIASLLAAWRTAQAPVIHVRHRSLHPDGLFRGPALEFKPGAEPLAGEIVIEKNVNSAFIGTDLEDRLRDGRIKTVVIAGLTTDHCCSTTARMAANLGFEVWFVSDATATFPRLAPGGRLFSATDMHESALASLVDEFADVIETSDAIRRLSSTA